MSWLAIGLMSGTSMDGIDAVLVDLADTRPRLIAAEAIAWQPELRQQLLSAAQHTPLTADDFARLDAEAGEAFAQAAEKLQQAAQGEPIRVIGSHGQTLAHNPNHVPGYTLQIGAADRIAETTGVTCVGNFRGRDIAAGGQGAPLVPAFHQAVFQSAEENRVILNIGGIANITVLPSSPTSPVTGFDTGPGNCLMDYWCSKHTGQHYDDDGAWGRLGSIDQELLGKCLSDSYFSLPSPKSTGTDYFSPRWLDEKLQGKAYPAEDVQATLAQLTVHSISEAIKRLDINVDRVLVCGGGSHNPVLMAGLNTQLPCPVESTAQTGIDPDWVEAIAFAWLAKQTLNNQPGNLAAVTGAAGPRVLGAIYPG